MEERKDGGQKPWQEAGFKTEDDWLDFWASSLEKSIEETQNKLNKIVREHWESEPQLAEFIQRLYESKFSADVYHSIVQVVLVDPCAQHIVITNSSAKDTILDNVLVLNLRGHDNGKFYRRFKVRNFLLSYSVSGKKWYEVARETDVRIQEVLAIAKRIRRNILYPEIEEMEKRMTSLEEEIHILTKWKTEIVRNLVYWNKKLDNIALRLLKTRPIFKSKIIAGIREDVERLKTDVFNEASGSNN